MLKTYFSLALFEKFWIEVLNRSLSSSLQIFEFRLSLFCRIFLLQVLMVTSFSSTWSFIVESRDFPLSLQNLPKTL